MISRLSIENYALIEKSVIDFNKGFIVITGETGAGKSIMLDALSLLMGARADFKAMGNKDHKTIVEAIFSSPDDNIKKLLDENNIDWDPKELIIRREISPGGKSRGFVNDTPVNLAVLSSISEKLIDIHSQHSNSLLNKSLQQLYIIDSFGALSEILANYQSVFNKYVSLRNRIRKIKEAKATGKENRDFIIFRLEQLDKIKPKRGELAILEKEVEILGNVDRIKSGLSEAVEVLSGPTSAIKKLQSASSILDDIDLDLLDSQGKDEIKERLSSLKIELRDISDTLESYSDSINSDPQRLEKVQARIESIYETMKRFKVSDEDELVALHQRLKEELSAIDGDETDATALEAELKVLAKELKERAEILTEARRKASEKFSMLIEERIRPLGLPNAKFKVIVEKGKMTYEGQDMVAFYCSFNKNHPIQPVSEIASGGEISRVMLGIKSIMADRMKLPTVIFDEIDTGVSGEIAHKMGRMMKDMSESMQVISVTHLPQVAANGDVQLKVYKKDNEEKTVSNIKVLTPEERVREIAGMLSGTEINDIALENARHLLNQN